MVEIQAFYTLIRNQAPKGLQGLQRCLSTHFSFSQFLPSPPWRYSVVFSYSFQFSAYLLWDRETRRTTLIGPVFKKWIKNSPLRKTLMHSFTACSDFFFLWFASWCRAVVWIIAVAWPVQSRKRERLPRIRLPSLSNFHMNSQPEGPPYSLKLSFLDNRMWRVKANSIWSYQGTSQ